VVVLIFAFLLVLLAVSNQPQVSMNLLFWKSPEVSLIVFVFAGILLGGIFATILGLLAQFKLKKNLGSKERQLKELKERITDLQVQVGKFEEVKEEKKSSPEIEPQEKYWHSGDQGGQARPYGKGLEVWVNLVH